MFVKMQPWFAVLMAVGNEPGDQMHDKIDGTAVTRMFNLRNILELVNDGLDDGSFARASVCPKGA
jgi:hypothetical protein